MIRPLFFLLSIIGLAASFPLHAQSSFYIKKGGLVSIKDSTLLTLQNMSLVNEGEFQPGSGTVSFIEDSSFSPIELRGKHPVDLNNVNINLLQSELTLAQTVNIKGVLRFKKGNINLGGNTLVLGGNSGYLRGENNKNHIWGSGKVEIAKSLTSGINHPGNLGLVIHTADSHQVINVIRRHEIVQTPDGQSIKRMYKIKGGKSKLKSSTFRLYFFDDELGNLSPKELNIWQSKGNDWILRPPLRVSADSNFVEFTLSRRGNFNKLTLAKRSMNRFAGESVDSLRHINVYPNPTQGAFWLDFGQETTEEDDLFVYIYTAQGQILQSLPVALGISHLKLSLASQSPGTYLISVRSHQEEIYTHSIIRLP